MTENSFHSFNAKRQRTNDNIPAAVRDEQITNDLNAVIDTDTYVSNDSLFGDDIPVSLLEEAALAQRTSDTPAPLQAKPEADLDEMDDLFGDDIPMELLDEALLDTPASPVHHDTKKAEAKRNYNRYLVVGIKLEKYSNERDIQCHELMLTLLETENNLTVRVHLRDDWMELTLAVGDIVHIPLAPGSDAEEFVIDNQQHYLIVQPDRLVSCTAVAESFFCLRKSILQLKIKSLGEYSEALVHGNIMHRVIQHAMRTNDFNAASIREEMRRIVLDSLEDLFAIDQDESAAMETLYKFVDNVRAFGETYVGAEPKLNATICKNMGSDVASEMGCTSVAISRILDIEEHVWSPTFGLKGMIDASIEMTLAGQNRQVLTVPFELKTGKSTRFLSHRAQTILYTLMMTDRYDVGIVVGALFYSRTNSLYLIPALRNELRSLLIARNELASAMGKQSLPKMVKNMHSCQHCSMNDACLVYHKALERGTSSTSGLGKWFSAKTQHISELCVTFFRHWNGLLDMEEEDLDFIRKDIWNQDGNLRELSGKCFTNMKCVKVVSGSESLSGRWSYTFSRSELDATDSNEKSMLISQFSVGDPVIVSGVAGDVNLGMGFVANLEPANITIHLTSPMRKPPQKANDFDGTHQRFYPTRTDFTQSKQNHTPSKLPGLFRIDKDEMAGGIALMRRNLVSILTSEEDGGDVKRRRLIVHLEKPAFRSVESITMPKLADLNPDQGMAIKKVLTAKDYALILGMPGTGKTTTTARLIQILVAHGKSVLVTAYTHSALDNVLLKVRDHGVNVLRLGNADKVMPQLQSSMPNGNPSLNSKAEMDRFYGAKVVGTTCLGVGHALFQRRKFDYCIVEEASQITLPTCIGPLRFADVFVLVGDPYQLPPVVKDERARREGLSKSLFALLVAAHPEAMANLEFQYRMNSDIMSISNKLIYDGKLKCGNHKVATKSLVVPRMSAGLAEIHGVSNTEKTINACTGSPCWLSDLIDPTRKVVFVNTDSLPAAEERPADKVIQNTIEVNLICQMVEALVACGMEEEQLAVISVYRSQLRLLSHSLKSRPNVEIATIDRYQGRDKECVLVSLVRSNAQKNSGDLLRDWRRLNVAFSRAKRKLLVFGSFDTLYSTALYRGFLDHLQSHQWIYALPKDAHQHHALPEHTSPEPTAKKGHRTFSPTQALLKKRPILKDVYNSA